MGLSSHIIVDSDGQLIQEKEQEYSSEFGIYFDVISQTLGKNKGIAQFFNLKGHTNKNSDSIIFCFTAAVENGFKTYIFDHENGITKNFIIEHTYEKKVVGLNVINNTGYAIVIY